MLSYEKKYEAAGKHIVIGVDEAGRGPLAGPVVAAAVYLRKREFASRVDDSKKLSSAQRNAAYLEIIRNSVFGIGIVNEIVIDRVNILGATKLAMKQSVDMLVERLGQVSPGDIQVLVDGSVPVDAGYPVEAIVKGDQKSMSISAASIIAKVTRDRIMDIYDKVYPDYGFARHKGYPTQAHREAIKKLGRSVIHRISFCSGHEQSVVGARG